MVMFLLLMRHNTRRNKKMYAELINKYRATNKLKIVEVNAKDFSEIDTKIFLRELNAGEKMHLYFIFENDLKNASEDEKLLFALNMALCDSEGNRTEKDENYIYLTIYCKNC